MDRVPGNRLLARSKSRFWIQPEERKTGSRTTRTMTSNTTPAINRFVFFTGQTPCVKDPTYRADLSTVSRYTPCRETDYLSISFWFFTLKKQKIPCFSRPVKFSGAGAPLSGKTAAKGCHLAGKRRPGGQDEQCRRSRRNRSRSSKSLRVNSAIALITPKPVPAAMRNMTRI